MGLPEWMLTVDSRKTRTLHGGTCIQFLLHFKGRSTAVKRNLMLELWNLHTVPAAFQRYENCCKEELDARTVELAYSSCCTSKV
jgi:hypothetical protein